MKVSDYIAEFFVEKGIKHIFTISGAGNVHLLNSIANNKNIEYICPHHEQAGVMATLAYKRISNRFSVMITTSGGGATNAITGVLDAWADSIPAIIISGQEKTQYVREHKNLRMWGVQGFDITKTVKNITKYSEIIFDQKTVKYHLEKAFYLSENGRPGPVWLDIPIDIQAAQINPNELIGFIPEKISFSIDDKIEQISSLISSSKRPLFLFGNGIRLSNGIDLLNTLIEKYKFPFLTAWNGKDMISGSHPLFFGHEGNYGQRCANFVIQNCDLLIAIGTRLAIPQIGYDIKEFARDAKKIVVDVDETELSKFNSNNSFITVQSDAKYFLEKLINKIPEIKLPEINNWIERCNKWKKDYPFVDERIHKETEGYLNSYKFIEELSKHFKKDEIIVTDMGTALTCTHQAIMLNEDQRIITSTGLGEMGYGMPGAIGACFASGKKRIILITGDGSMMMNLQELQTIAHHKLPIKIFIYINDGYLTIKNTQMGLFGKKFTGSGKESGVSCPDFAKVGKAFGFKTFKIKTSKEISKIISDVLEEKGPVICEVLTHPLQPLVPKLSFSLNPDGTMVSPPIEDLFPFLTREQLEKEMLIELHEKSKKIKI